MIVHSFSSSHRSIGAGRSATDAAVSTRRVPRRGTTVLIRRPWVHLISDPGVWHEWLDEATVATADPAVPFPVGERRAA